MKKKLLIRLSGWLTPMLILSSSFAQEFTYHRSHVNGTAAVSMITVNAKVNKAFNAYFKNITDFKWNELNKKYLVQFIQDDQQNRALFARNGDLIYHIIYGKEKNLPTDVRTTIKREYIDHEIINAIKVNQGNRHIWVVLLENCKNYIHVRVENRELEETQRIQKSY